jgi:hypothetical protein
MTTSGDRVQAFIELRSEDAEAVSAFEVARRRLEAGRGLRALRRVRVFEISGDLPPAAVVEDLLHRSTRFYNPAKERCSVRRVADQPAPFREEERFVLVTDRGLERRSAAERWWRHETGRRVEVREALAWVMAFEPGVDADACAESLATVTDREHGLFRNPHYQDGVVGAGGGVPWGWNTSSPRRRAKGGA